MSSDRHPLQSTPAEIVNAAMTRMQTIIWNCDDRTRVAMDSCDELMSATEASIGKSNLLIKKHRRALDSSRATLRR